MLIYNQMKQKEQNAFRIIYNMETDEYYKIHKNSGTTIRVNKDGTEVKKFQPGITGHSESVSRINIVTNLKNQVNNTNARKVQLSPLSIRNIEGYQLSTKNNVGINKQGNSLKQKKSVEVKSIIKAKDQNNSVKALKKQNQNNNINQLRKSKLKPLSSIHQKDFFSKDTQVKPKAQIAPDQFSLTLEKFNEMNKYRAYQNHSLNKDIPGSNPIRSPERIKLANKKYFETQIDFYNPSISAQGKNLKSYINANISRLSENFDRSQQFKRQRELFFKLHPEKKIIQRSPDKHRKQNLKRLQLQSIEQFEKQTNKIYE